MFFLAIHTDLKGQYIAFLRKEKNNFYIDHTRILHPNVKPLYTLQSLIQGKPYQIVTGLESREILLREIQLKLKSRREILSALPFQIENLLPYPLEEVILLPTLYPKEKTDVFFIATSKQTLQEHLQKFAAMIVDPDIVSCIPLALYRFVNHYFPSHPSLIIYHLGDDQSIFVTLSEGRLKHSQTQNFGRNHLLANEPQFTQDLDRMIAFLRKKNSSIKHILFTGQTQGLESTLKKNFPSSFSCLEMEKSSLKEFAIPIGLALDAAISDKQSGQFRSREMLSKKHLEKRKKSTRSFLAACFCCFFIVLIFGNFHLKKRENALLNTMNTPKGTSLYKAVDQLEKSISNQKRPLISAPNTPKLSEILLWLSTHPKLSQDVSITHLRYSLVKSPKLGSSTTSYCAKLELELTTQSSRFARGFHEALLSDKQWIDQARDVKWSADRGIYRTSFFLKPLPSARL